MNYYNEHDPFAAAWLRELIADGLIADGEVDERSIVDVRADDLRGFRQCHFFAGIGGWSYALRLAGVPDDEAIWTGSCPCQPLSCAGLGQGHVDERHLWPAFQRLIAECSPPTIFGEQVASKAGREWFAGVRADLENMGYACGGLDLCAAGVGAPHIRQRLYWMADRLGTGLEGHAGDGDRWHESGREQADATRPTAESSVAGGLDDAGDERRRQSQHAWEQSAQGIQPRGSSARRFWDGADIIPCTDGKARRTGPGIQPLAHGVPNRMGTLRGAGNAIVPQVAAEFIRAAFEATA